MTDSIQYQGGLAANYSSEARVSHPQSVLPYVCWLKELGDLRGLRVLDLACGSGFSTRLLAERGACVTGVDISEEMIALARSHEEQRGIKYLVSDALELYISEAFNVVTPSFLFNYARDEKELLGFMQCVARHLLPGGKMLALNAPPDPIVPRLPNASHSSEWLMEPYKEGSMVRLHLYDLQGNSVCDIDFRYWSQETYEKCLACAGFRQVEWLPLEMTEEGKLMFANWQELERHNCSIVLKAIRN